MASITKRGNSYLIRCSAGYDVNGKQIVENMTWKIPPGMTEKKAEKEAHHQAVLFEEAIRTNGVLDGKVKLYKFIERWVEEYANVQLRPRTVERYEDCIPRINEHLGHLQMGKIRPQHLTSFYKELNKPHKSFRYVYNGSFKSVLSEMNLSQVKCSELCNTSLDSIKKLCKGESINTNNAKKIVDKLNLSLKNDFIIEEHEIQLSNKSIQNYHRLLSSIFSTAVMWQVIGSNPALRVQPPKVKKVKVNSLEEEDTLKMLDALKDEPLQFQTAIIISVYCGTRRGELVGLKWSDIDFENETLSICRSVQYIKKRGGIIVDETKNESSVRVIKITDEVIQTLRRYKAEQSELRLLLGNYWNDEDWIFTRDDGTVKNPNDITIAFKKFVRRIGLPEETHLHSLRHTNASLLIALNTNLQTVANRLGHSDTTTTARIYSHAIKHADAVASEKLDIILNKNRNVMYK